MTRIAAYVDTTFEIELDEEGQKLFDADDGELYAYLAARIKISAEDVGTFWEATG